MQTVLVMTTGTTSTAGSASVSGHWTFTVESLPKIKRYDDGCQMRSGFVGVLTIAGVEFQITTKAPQSFEDRDLQQRAVSSLNELLS